MTGAAHQQYFSFLRFFTGAVLPLLPYCARTGAFARSGARAAVRTGAAADFGALRTARASALARAEGGRFAAWAALPALRAGVRDFPAFVVPVCMNRSYCFC